MRPLRTILIATLLFLCVAGIPALGQLSGTKTVNSAGGADYLSVAAAVAALNAQGVGTGGVTFEVAAGHAEFASNILLTDSTSSATAPVVFQKSGAGANPLIIASPGSSSTTDGMVKIAGTDYLTIDGIDLKDTASTLGPTAQMEWGYALVKANAMNGCQHVAIRNCSVSLIRTHTLATGIYAANNTAGSTAPVTLAGPSGAHSHNRFSSNTITNTYAGIYLSGYADGVAPYSLYDQNNEIGIGGGNTITNFGGGASSAYGILTVSQNNLKVAQNILNSGGGHTGTLRGIYLSTALNANADVFGNTVTLASGAATNVYGLHSAAGGSGAVPGTDNRVRIYDNIVEDCDLSALTTGGSYLLYQTGSPADLEVHGNIVRNNTRGGSSPLYLLHQAGTVVDTALIRDNMVTDNAHTGSGAAYCLSSAPGATTISVVSDNTVTSCSASGAGTVYGLSLQGGLRNIGSENRIHGLSSGGGVVHGVHHASPVVGMEARLHGNLIHDLSAGGAGSGANGIFVAGGATVLVYNNMVSDLSAASASNTVASLSGIYISGGGTVGAYFNTILLDGSSTAATFGTSGIYASVTPTVDLRNNIVVNRSTPGVSGGTTAAYRRSGANLTGYAAASGYNNWYAGAPSATRLIFADGVSSDSTLAAFQTRVAPRDAGSITEDPPFINAVSAPYDLHINVAVPTGLDSAGTPVTTPVLITGDFDNELRDPAFPDIGADEFAVPPPDILPPAFVYTPLGNTSATANRPLTVTITDPAGVADAPNGPRLYYRKSTDAGWTFDASPSRSGSDYTFLIDHALLGGGGVFSGDTISYYVAAQDSLANAGTNPPGGSGGSPPGTVPPPSPAQYLVLVTPPDPAVIVSPVDAAVDVPLTASLNWGPPPGGPAATGYRVFFGTDNPPTNIANGTDLGDVLTYDPPGNLLYGGSYFWRIVPYNALGDAAACPVWSFSTLPDPTITSFPYTQSFDSTLFPPYGWQDSGTKPWQRTTTDFRTAPGGAGTTFDPAGTAILLMPPANIPAGHQIRFWWRDGDLTPGPEVVNHDTTFFEISTDGGTTWILAALLSAALPEPGYSEQVVDLTPFAGNGILMRWRDVSDGSIAAAGIGLDDIRLEAITRNVTFQVNMRVKALAGLFDPAADAVTVRGSFNDWGNSTNNPDTLTDADNDSIYTGTIPLPEYASYAYKFWKTLRGGVEWEDGITDRALNLGAADTLLPAVYFNDDGPDVAVTFHVNMSVKMLEGTFQPGSGDAVTVRGSFNDWGNSTNNPDTLQDGNADSVYTGTFQMPSGRTIAYKFWKTLRGGIDYEGAIPNRQYAIPLDSPVVIPADYFDRDSVVHLPAFTADPASLVFGGVTVGDSLYDTVTVRNSGTGTLNISAAVITGSADFTLFGTIPVALAPSDSALFAVRFSPATAGPAAGGLDFTHDAPGSPGSVALSGTGIPVGPVPKFLTVTPDTIIAKDPAKLKFWKPVKRFKGLRPNWANLLDETVAQGGFQPAASESDSAGGMVLGISHMYLKDPFKSKWAVVKDSAALRAWVRLTKWDFKKSLGKSFNALQKTLEDKTGRHDLLPARGFDFTTDGKNKPILKQQTKLVPKKQDNVLFAELVALKLNIAASALGKTPAGFGELLFDRNASAFDEQPVNRIAATVDTMMTYWQLYDSTDFADAYTTVHDINRAFVGPFDTASFNVGGLVLNGAVEITSVPYMKLPVPFIATRMRATTDEVESGEDHDFEDEEFEESETPVAAKLYQNYPNPFNPATTVGFRLLEGSQVTIRIYDMLGREVATVLAGEEVEEGYNEVVFSAAGLSSGVYFYRIDVQGLEDAGLRSVLTGKMILMK